MNVNYKYIILNLLLSIEHILKLFCLRKHPVQLMKAHNHYFREIKNLVSSMREVDWIWLECNRVSNRYSICRSIQICL